MDIMLSRWLLYQTLACRVWARSAFYQAGGSYGFRDQLQDVMALTVAQRATAREQLIRGAASPATWRIGGFRPRDRTFAPVSRTIAPGWRMRSLII
jgi:hypothetical protein